MRYTDWDSPEFADLSVSQKLEAITAAAAANAVEAGDGALPDSAEEVEAGAEFVIPLLIPEELESGDGRKMEKDALSTRDLPITLLWQPATGDGHNNSYIVGRIDSIERLDNGLGNAKGVFDTGPYGREAERLVRTKMLRGVSADLDEFEATVNGEELADDADPSTIKNEKMVVKKARVMAATLVAKPAFQQCTIELTSDADVSEEGIPLDDGIYEETPLDGDSAEYTMSSLIASAAPVNPPKSWFDQPTLTGPTPLTVDDDGHVFGHIATWDTDHVGMNPGVKPPRSRSNYAYFRTGMVKTIEGEDVAVGQLTLLGGHAPLDANAQMAVKHYDDTQSAVADVNAGEDQFGIWVSGAMRPSVTPEQVRVFRASAPSGDWRPINGVLELVACCQVNVPGFPVARARVASGAVMALVAAGTQTLQKIRKSETDELSTRLGQVERVLLERRKQELAAEFAPIREARIARLREAAAQARERLAPELDRRAQEAAQLAADAEAARQRVAEFKLNFKPDFEEKHHPRDDEGKFREVLVKLSDILKKPDAPAAAGAEDALQRAADAEDAGDSDVAKAAADEAKSAVETAASEAEGEASDALRAVADDIARATGEAAEDVATGDTPDAPANVEYDDLPDEIKDLIETMIDEVGEGVDPQSILSRMDNQMRHWLEGKGFRSPEEMLKLIEKMMQRPIQPDIGQ